MTRASTAAAGTSHEVRFQFGKNWGRFLGVLDGERIAEAERSLTEMLQMPDLRGRSFLDVGSGSGLLSLAAKRLGAKRVHSFDYDADSVASTRELKRRFYANDTDWTVEQGSVLDPQYLQSLGTFDIVYSWGVLHHTGDMWRALDGVTELVGPGGRLFVAIYNDQGVTSRRWMSIKRLYNQGPVPIKLGLIFAVGTYWGIRGALRRFIELKNPLGVLRFQETKEQRGMSLWHDLVDWVGGYPFEVAKPEDVVELGRTRGLALERLKTVGGTHGNNEFVFIRDVR